MLKRYTIGLLAASLFVVGCGTDTNDPAPVPVGTALTQVEQLARPAINEGLIFTNAFLNTYNAVGPAFIAAALANPQSTQGVAAAPVLAEATVVLNIFTGLNAVGITTPQAVRAFLPDVMRIDTSLAIPVATQAYDFAIDPTDFRPIAGRKLTDDVIDVTVNLLTGGAVAGDRVPYYPRAGNPGVGHQRLQEQLVDFGSARFPFLAPAN